MHERDYFLKKARKSGLTEDWSTYRCLRNRVTNTIRRAKESYNRRIIEENGNDSKAFWKTIKFNDVTESFVLAQLSGLKIRKAAGLDNIPPRLLKDSATIVAKPLTDIINASLRQSKIPDAWKAARAVV